MRSSSWRLGVAAIGFACLLGQVSALAHRVLVRHVTCAEHGESVHLGLAVDDGSPQSSPEADSSDRGATDAVSRIADASPVAADEHDHCSVLLSRGVTSRSQHDRALGPAPSLSVGDLPGDATLGPVIAPYLVAPKTSPPHAAS